MTRRMFSLFYLIVCAAFLSLVGVTSAYAQTESVIHSFRSTSVFDGVSPFGGIAAGKSGALYGTTVSGGKFSHGAVYKLSPPAAPGGAWRQSILYPFTGAYDGSSPMGSLVLNLHSGKIYGTAQGGGSQNSGVVFELVPPAKSGAPWTELVLYNFTGLQDGGWPENGLVADPEGRLYGTTYLGGRYQSGVAFRLSSSPGGVWTEDVIYNFRADADGGHPDPSGLVFGAAGVIYGTTQSAGTGQGTVFELAPPSGGTGVFTESDLYAFSGINGDGLQPVGTPVLDSSGALYGSTLQGGQYSEGAVFQLSPPATQGSGWKESILYSIASSGSDGYFPSAGLVFDVSGALNGVTELGGDASCNCGTAFKLSPPSITGGAWTFSLLHTFGGGSDGAFPQAPLFPSGQSLFGSTYQGGTSNCQRFGIQGCGTVFEITQ